MRNGLLGAIAALAACAGLSYGQGPFPPPGAKDLNGPGLLPPNPMAQQAGPYDPANQPGPFGPNGEPCSTAEGLFGAGGAEAQHLGKCWARGEFLLWGVKVGPTSSVPLIQIGSIFNDAVPGLPGSITVFGGNGFDYGGMAGARFAAGGILPGSSCIGLEAEGMILPRRDIRAAAVSGPLGIPVVGRPFINELTGQVEAIDAGSLANPGGITGSAYSTMWAAELDLYANVYNGDAVTWSVLSGFRHFNLAEGFRVNSTRTINTVGQFFLGNPLAVGTTTEMEDKFDTFNHFYGWNLGGTIEYRWRRLAFTGSLRVALGDVRRSVTRQGFSSQTVGVGAAAVTTRVPGGLLAGITNIGTMKDNEFTALPDLRFDAQYQLTRHIRVGFGYGVMYINKIMRPGSQIDPVINPALQAFRVEYGTPVGSARPFQIYRPTDYWAQGVNWSLTVTY